MRIRIAALPVGLVLLVGALLAPPAGAGPSQGEENQVTLYFKGQSFTTAQPSPGNATEESASANGRPFLARFYGTVIGEWSFICRQDIQIQGSFQATLWARSAEGAKNAGFRLNFYIGDNLMEDLYTNRQDVSGPTKFTISDSLTAAVPAGRTVKVGLVWLSDPNYIVGPSSGGEFIYGSADHDSSIVLTLASPPISLNISAPERERSSAKLVVTVNESLGMDPATLTYRIAISGPANVLPEHISAPVVFAGDNSTTVTWVWDLKKSRAQTGEYTFTASASYDGVTFYSNSSQYALKFETEPDQGFFSNPTSGGNLLVTAAIIALVAVVVASSVFLVIRRRRKRRIARAAAAEALPAQTA
ncbi:MAG: hypothetical protein ACUVV6_01705 [Thermoplasmatota archaeon]